MLRGNIRWGIDRTHVGHQRFEGSDACLAGTEPEESTLVWADAAVADALDLPPSNAWRLRRRFVAEVLEPTLEPAMDLSEGIVTVGPTFEWSTAACAVFVVLPLPGRRSGLGGRPAVHPYGASLALRSAGRAPEDLNRL